MYSYQCFYDNENALATVVQQAQLANHTRLVRVRITRLTEFELGYDTTLFLIHRLNHPNPKLAKK